MFRKLWNISNLFCHGMLTGFELLTKKRILNERPEVERLAPMTHDEFQQYVDDDGRVMDVDPLKQRIFRGVSELRTSWPRKLIIFDFVFMSHDFNIFSCV